METKSEIDRVIETIKQQFPNVKLLQLTSFGEKPFESGVWEFRLEGFDDCYVRVEVQNGICFANYFSKTFSERHSNTALTICGFFKKIQDLETER